MAERSLWSPSRYALRTLLCDISTLYLPKLQEIKYKSKGPNQSPRSCTESSRSWRRFDRYSTASWRTIKAVLISSRGVDKSVIDLMRPLFSLGVRPEQFRDMLLELATKKHAREYLKREHKITRMRRLNPAYATDSMFSEFGDQSKYCGYVPCSNYFSSVFKSHAQTIRTHMENEVKKRGAKFLRWDVSYKEVKKLCRFRGSPVYKGRVTATNELGEVHTQFHIVTDGHDQMINALAAFRNTATQYGQDLPQFVFTDKPKEDYNFFRQHLPSLVQKEDQLNNQSSKTVQFSSTGIPDCEIELSEVQFADTVDKIDSVIFALHAHLKNVPESSRVIGLDEEHEYGSKQEFPPLGRGKVALIQLAFELSPGKTRAILIKSHSLNTLPKSLIQLFSDTTVRYVGVKVSGDIRNIGQDFKISTITKEMRFLELAKMAKDRGVVSDARVGLQKLVLLVLKQNMSKDDDVRSSKWANTKLSDAQKEYAALDATKSLEIYLDLASKTNYSARIKSIEAKNSTMVDVIAPPWQSWDRLDVYCCCSRKHC